MRYSYESRKYRALIDFIALNDDPGSPDSMDIDSIGGYVTVQMIRHVYKLKTEQVARDVLKKRKEHFEGGAR